MLRQVGTLTYPARYTPGVRQGNKEGMVSAMAGRRASRRNGARPRGRLARARDRGFPADRHDRPGHGQEQSVFTYQSNKKPLMLLYVANR